MNNIFKGAKFGDKYIRRDGKISIFTKYEECFPDNLVWFINEYDCRCGYSCDYVVDYHNKGEIGYSHISDVGPVEENGDIVSRYQEPINEEKLNALALDWDDWDNSSNENEWSYTSEDIRKAYKAGYRKAIKNIYNK